jgi:hypothetical protein
MQDLFENYGTLPKEVKEILINYSEAEDYKDLEAMKNELEEIGYTFEYDLNCIAFNLQKL